MTTYALAAVVAFSPMARAEAPETRPDWSEFQKLMERFSDETQEFLQDWITDFTPLLESLRDKVDDLSQYEPPEVLPNGDIIIRRKPDLPPGPAPDAPPGETQQAPIDL